MKPTPEVLRKSIAYNREHAEEHQDAIEDRKKDLAKAQKDRAKLVEKMAKQKAKS